MANVIEIVLKAVDQATAPLKNVSKSLENVEDQAESTGGGARSLGLRFTELSSVINLARMGFDMVYGAMKKVYELGKEGASLEYAASKFDRLAESAGTTADVLLRDLRAAVKGTRSDMELMGGAGDFMALGLAKSHDEVVRLTRVAGALNMNMNQLVLTLTNQTTMRFDALGVSVDGFKEKVKELEEAGMDTNAAFKEAFLQQAEQQINRVGDAAETDAGKIMRMEAATKNLSNAVKVMLAPAIADASESMADAITKNQRLNDSLDILYDKYTRGEFTLEEYRKEVDKVSASLEDEGSNFEILLAAIGGYNKKTAEAKLETSELSGEVDEIILRWRAAEPAAADVNEQLRAMAGAAGDAADETNNLADAEQAAKDKADALMTNMKALTTELLFNKAAAGLDADAAYLLATNMGLIDSETETVMKKLDDLKAKYDTNADGAIDAAEAAAGYTRDVWLLNDAIASLKDKNVKITTEHIDTFQRVYLEDAYRGDERFGGEQFHSGANFVVPPGYPNDSFGPIYVESGERVIVVPKEHVKDARTFNFNYTGNATPQQIQQQYEMARLLN